MLTEDPVPLAPDTEVGQLVDALRALGPLSRGALSRHLRPAGWTSSTLETVLSRALETRSVTELPLGYLDVHESCAWR
jgi:hypothetical protein